MKKANLRSLSMLVCIVFTFTFYLGNVFAIPNTKKVVYQENGIKFYLEKDNKNETVVMAQEDGEKFYVAMNKKTDEISIKHIEISKKKFLGFKFGNDKVKNYDVKMEYLTKDYIEGTIIERDTKKEIKVKSNNKYKAQPQFVLSLSALAIAGMYALLTTTAVVLTIIVAGETYTLVSEWVKTKAEEDKNKNSDHFVARIENDNVYIGAPLTLASAVIRLKGFVWNENNVFSKTWLDAYNVARLAGDGIRAIPHDPHGGAGYFPHYHIAPYNSLQGHSFYAF